MIRIGVDFGGTKIEAAALDSQGRFLSRVRAPSPRRYDAALETVKSLVEQVEREAGVRASTVGVGGPGSPSPATGLMRNANSTELNGHPFPVDLARVLGRPVRYANDANCLALSEAVDGAAGGADVVFAVILGTGCGAGLAVKGRIVEGRNGVAGEWGHMPLPWPREDEFPGPACWCGRRNCMELWVSGSGLARADGGTRSAEAIAEAAAKGEPASVRSIDQFVDRLARGLAVVADVVDPDVIVLGGGLSNLQGLAERLPAAMAPYVFADAYDVQVRPALHGDSSGVRGAAWLWPIEPEE